MEGRPKETLADLPNECYNSILEIYKDGASDVEVKAMIYEWRGSFSNDLWDRWMEEEKEFSETIKTGKILSEAWWSKTGRKNLENKDFSFTGWYMNMKNRFKWRDRIDQDITTDGKPIIPKSIPLVLSDGRTYEDLTNDLKPE